MDDLMRRRTVKSIHSTVMTFYKKGFKDCAYSVKQAMEEADDKFITLDEMTSMIESLDEVLEVTLAPYSEEVERGIDAALKTAENSGEITE